MSKKSDPSKLIQTAVKNLHSKTPKYPDFNVGDTIKVHVRVKEGDKTRIQVFEGVVIRRRNGGASASFTVRKVSYGVGVERIFPVYSPVVDKITLVSQGEVRRAKLYYLRALSGRASRIKSEHVYETEGAGTLTPSSPAESSQSTTAPEVSAKAAQG